MAKAKANKAWFKPLRRSYIARNYKGALSYIPFIAYLALSLLLPLHYLSSKATAIFIAIPNWVVATIVMTAFAKSKSKAR
jgi:hypothetical protein